MLGMRLRLEALLAAVLLLILAACGTEATTDEAGDGVDEAADEEPADASDDPVKVAFVMSNPLNDGGWTQAMVEGARALEAEGEIEITTIAEEVSDDPATATRVISQLAAEDNDLVVTHSFGFGEALLNLAPDFPDVNFAWAGGIDGTAENVADYDQPFYQAAYLAGILAAGHSQTGIFGGLAGFDIPVCRSQLEAFTLGAQRVHPDIEQINSFTGSWVDAALATEATLAQAEQGADTFMFCGVDHGGLEAVKQLDDVTAIGYVRDQSDLAPDHVLASIVWDLRVLLKAMADDIRAGTFQPGKFYQLGVAEDGLRVDINPAFEDSIPDDAMAEYEAVLEQIRAGEYEVPYIPEAE